MKHRAVQRLAGKLRRGFGWRLCAFALAGLIVDACAGTLFGPRKPLTGPQSYQSPQLAVVIQAGELNFIPAPGSGVELQGKSTLGSWKSRSTDIHGKIVLDADATALNAIFDRIQSAAPHDKDHAQPNLPTLTVRNPPIGDILVPVMSLHGDSGGMDRDMQSALNVKQHPSIEFVFQQLQQTASQWNSQNTQASLKLRIVGTLYMAGVGRPITMDVIVKRDSRGHFLAHAQTALLMTDFGMTPPGALLGLIKANDQVLVVFDLDLILVDHPPGR